MKSIWSDTKKNINYQSLDCDIERNIVVVGGGIAGILTSYTLAERGNDVTLVEAEKILNGVTEKTTAHIEALSGYIYSELIRKNFYTAKGFFDFQIEAIDEYEKLVNKYNIECGFERVDSYLYSMEKSDKLKDEYIALKNIGAEAEYIENVMAFDYNLKYAVKLKNQAVFNPIMFLNGLPTNYEIFENTRIDNVDFKEKILYCGKYKIKAEKIVIATNFPIINFPGWFFIKMYKSSSYAMSFPNFPNTKKIYESDKEDGLTLRNDKNCIIIGGLDHRTGRIDEINSYEKLEKESAKIFDAHKPVYRWSANDCITFDGLPYVGYYGKKSKDVFIISGFNKLGMSKALGSAMMVSDLINGGQSKYEKIFCPQRRIICNPGFFKNLLQIIKNLVIMNFTIPLKCYKSLNNNEGDIVLYKGRRRAVYKDSEGNFHICQSTCQHLHCLLAFNKNDLTWDCPCHGSRFNIDGNIITAPTVKKLKKY